jgi:adenine-specific DNA-methyltransferase
MKFRTITPKSALNKSFLKDPILAEEILIFKQNLVSLLNKIQTIEASQKDESEEHLKNNIRDFLRDTYYKSTNAINTKDKKDLVIHTGLSTESNVGVIIEAKRPSNKSEMFTIEKPNAKALHELILYYLDERNEKGNIELKNLVLTNINQWYIIDANYFDKIIYRNTKIKNLYSTYKNDNKDNPWFYEEVAKLVSSIDSEIPCVYFDIRNYRAALESNSTDEDENLISLQKVLSGIHLLKLPFSRDSNVLDERFYKELLYIVGLEEHKDKKSGKVIISQQLKNRNPGTLIESAINIIETEGLLENISDLKSYGSKKDEQTFHVALELCITWINRILFLKLLESQIVKYHNSDKNYEFLYFQNVPTFGELYKLFHQVLARKLSERPETLKEKYKKVPYLNSSLFEISPLEKLTIKINQLDSEETIPLLKNSVLKDQSNETNRLPPLEYLFTFLQAYNFASEGKEYIIFDKKRLINASVLGKVFEKINGYKDGSVYTPGFITEYISRQAIRKAIINKFRDAPYSWQVDSFDDLKNYLADHKSTKDILKFNDTINSIKICDPAVGSGHFLVSALNEIVASKAYLGLLANSKGLRITDYEVEVSNDELIVTDLNGNIFEYRLVNGKPSSKEMQNLQETLFHEKEILIENCLFGVDINHNSVKICSLRLWIELLKNAYYQQDSFTELETLPNIDINIKCGNSIVNRYKVIEDIAPVLKKADWSIKTYKDAVFKYKNATNKEETQDLLKLIGSITGDVIMGIAQTDKRYIKLTKKRKEFSLITTKTKLLDFEMVKGGSTTEKERIEDLRKEIEQLEKVLEKQKNSAVYHNAFEWRIMFPEVLDNAGKFEGFDVVIGNPPYGVSIKGLERETIVSSYGKVPDYEIYYYFINLSKSILRDGGINSFIIPNTILFNVFAKTYREGLFNNWQLDEILDCTNFNIFEGSATVRCIIATLSKKVSDDSVFYRRTENATSFQELIETPLSKTNREILLANNQNWALVFKLSPEILSLTQKIREDKTPLISKFPELSQGLIAYDKYQGQDQETIDNRVYHSEDADLGWQKWLWGEDVTPYRVKWNGKEYINYSGEIANPREPKYFKGERILVREITNPKIYAAYTNKEYYNDPAIINILPNKKGKFDLKVLLAILNSSLASFYHFNSSPKATKGAFPKILVEDIKNFPLPLISEKEQKVLIALVDEIHNSKKAGEDSTIAENKIDQLVFDLYDIDDYEQSLIKSKLKDKSLVEEITEE